MEKKKGCPVSFPSFWNFLGCPCCDTLVSTDDVHYSQTLGVLCPNDLFITAGQQGTAFGVTPKIDSSSLFGGTKHIYYLPMLCSQKKTPHPPPPTPHALLMLHLVYIRSIIGHRKSWSRVIYQNASSTELAGIWDWIYPRFSSGFRHVLPCFLHSPLYSNLCPEETLMAMCQSTRLGVRIVCISYQLCSWFTPVTWTCHFSQNLHIRVSI